jgi:peptidoglycan/xylan/chitin deacetylase (PgdA/CDA1 family)
MWTIDPQDWRGPGSTAIVDHVVARVSAGDVVLLHDGGGDRSQTVRALDQLLSRLGRAGFTFTALPDC